jgi:N6-adenosine-specific RNA methylase IME4
MTEPNETTLSPDFVAAEAQSLGLWDVAMIDPPWQKRKGGKRVARPNQGRTLDYPTMSVEEIFSLLDKEVFSHGSDTHTVFIWLVDEYLHAGEAQMESRGYRRHARPIWDKCNGVAPPFSVRYAHEYLTWYYKPNFIPVSTESRGKLTTVIREAAREHSRKPESSYAAISAWYPNVRKADIFSRQPRKGWAQYGNQAQYFSASDQNSN